MKLIVNENRTIAPIGTWGSKNENNYEIIDVELPTKFSNYNKRIVYYLNGEVRWDIIVDNKITLTNAVTKYRKVQAYIWLTSANDVDFRTQLFEMRFNENQNADGLIPSEEQIDGFNDMLTVMNEKIAEVDNIDIDLSEKVDAKVTLTITKKDGTTEETEIVDGTDGVNGVGLNYNWNGTELGIKREDESEYNYVDLKGNKGDTGATGQDGQDGYTPVKGVDYFTLVEINEFTTTITNNVNQNIGLRLDEINGEVI